MPNHPAQRAPYDSPTGAHPEPVPLVSQSDLVNPLLTVADAMTAGPRTCSPFSTVVEAVLIFRDARCGVVPVTEDGKPVGVVTDRDVALALADHDGSLAGNTVADVMGRGVVTIRAEETLEHALEKLGGEGVRRLMVVDGDDRLVGVLSWSDLAPHVSERALGQVVRAIASHR